MVLTKESSFLFPLPSSLKAKSTYAWHEAMMHKPAKNDKNVEMATVRYGVRPSKIKAARKQEINDLGVRP